MINMFAVLGAATHQGLAGASIVLIALFAALAGYDGVNLHLVRYRLWARPESRLEHRVHTLRAILFPAILVLVFTGRTGLWLWAGIAIVLVDTVIEAFDVAIEPASRARLGGLSATEGVIHNVLGTRPTDEPLETTSSPTDRTLEPA